MKDPSNVAALYMRMSKEDDDIRFLEDKEESNSITNQRMLLYDYLKTHPEFENYEVIEFCDDGYSGKRFDRPQFQRMLDGVKNGTIRCILVKDFSRFSRDYMEMGKYLEQIFPFFQVRFIAVTDRYDSKEGENGAIGLEVAFKNFIADFYSRDTSRKIRSVRDEMAKEGKFASANPPYGYLKSPDDRHKLIVDEETAPVVRKIFQLKLDGFSVMEITRILNEKGIPSPAQAALQKKWGKDGRKSDKPSGWNPAKVSDVLKDERYAGNMVSMKRRLKGIYGKATPVAKEKWVRVQNTHEGIVSYEDFLRTQDTFSNHRKRKSGEINRVNVFVCAYCGRKLSYSRDGKKLICRYGKVNPQTICSHAVYSSANLRGAVMAALQWHLKQFLSRDPSETILDPSLYEKEIASFEGKKVFLYEKYRAGMITKEEYRKRSSRINAQNEKLRNAIRIMKEKEKTKADYLSQWMDQYGGAGLTKELEEGFIDQVLVYDAEHINIQWKFQDVFCS